MEELAFEAGFFDKPAGVDFVLALGFEDWVAFVAGGFGFALIEIDIFKEGAGAGLLEGVGEFFGADGGNDCADAFGAKISDIIGFDVAFDRSIEGASHLAWFKLDSDRDNKVTVFVGGIEDAFAIGKF